MKKQVYLISAGMGAADLMTRKALRLLTSCSIIFAPQRLAEIYKMYRGDIVTAGIEETLEKASATEKNPIGILISGDGGFYSVAKRIRAYFEENAYVETVSGISSISYLSARIGINYDDMAIISLHGRKGSVLGPVSYNKKTFVLTGGEINAVDICKSLTESGLGEVQVFIGEYLSMQQERLSSGVAADFINTEFADLASMIIINKNFSNPYKILKDDDFIRGSIPMTKAEIRRLCIGEMAAMPTDIIYDIGAGTGSVAIELARKALSGLVFAVEKEPEAIKLINQNKKKFGTYNLIPIESEAPENLDTLPVPDKVFIGGSGKRLQDTVEKIYERNKNVKFVITAITLETLNSSIKILENIGFEADVVCINAAKAKKTGGYHMMMAANPVYIISGEPIG